MNFSLLKFFKEIGISGLLDIAFMSVLIYALIVWFKRSKAFFVLTGIFIIGIIYLLAREFNLQLVAAVFQVTVAVPRSPVVVPCAARTDVGADSGSPTGSGVTGSLRKDGSPAPAALIAVTSKV